MSSVPFIYWIQEAQFSCGVKVKSKINRNNFVCFINRFFFFLKPLGSIVKIFTSSILI